MHEILPYYFTGTSPLCGSFRSAAALRCSLSVGPPTPLNGHRLARLMAIASWEPEGWLKKSSGGPLHCESYRREGGVERR